MAVSVTTFDQRLLRTRRKTIRELKPDILWDANYGIDVADGARVSSWTPVIGTGTLAHETADNQPRWLQHGIGQQAAVLFAGGQYLYGHVAPLVGSLGTVAMMVQLTSTTGEQVALSGYDNSDASYYLDLGVNNNKIQIRSSDPGSDAVYGGTSLGTTKHTLIYTTNEAGTAWRLFADGSEESLTVLYDENSGKWFGDVAGIDYFTIGAYRNAGARSFTGYIAYIAGWNKLL